MHHVNLRPTKREIKGKILGLVELMKGMIFHVCMAMPLLLNRIVLTLGTVQSQRRSNISNSK